MATTHDASQTQSEGAELTRVEDLWFPTDIIVIRTESKIFRVFSGVLAAKSSVFRDMIAFPQPPETETENIDGHPVVRLHDKPEDVEVFLRALYDSEYFMPSPAPVALQAVLAILRLSHKYDVPYLYRRALDHLIADEWYRRTYHESCVHHIDHSGITSPMVCLLVIVTAIQVKADWLLPCAYFCAATYSAEQLSQHMDGETHDCALKAITTHAHLVRGMIDIKGCYLSAGGSSTCTTIRICAAAREASISRLLKILSNSWVNPLARLPRELEKFAGTGACNDCLEDAKTKQHEAASKFWDELPQIFGLPPWKDLRAMKRAAMGQDDGSSDEESGEESD